MFKSLIGLFSGGLINELVGAVLAPLTDIFKAYLNKEITESQLREKLGEALLQGFSSVEASFQDSLAKSYASFMEAARQSRVMQIVWASVCISQLLVLLWHQVGIPALVYWLPGAKYPSSGATVDWAYALIALCLGAPALSARIGPASSWAADTLGKLVKR